MGDHHDRAVEVVEQRAEPLAARHVEVGLGLVEQQHVGPPREAGGERDELALAAGELARGDARGRSIPSARRWPSASPSARSPPASVQRASSRSWCASARVIASRSAASARVGEPRLGGVQLALERRQLGPRGAHRRSARRARRRRRSAAGGRARARGAPSPCRRRRGRARRRSAAASTCRRRWGRGRRSASPASTSRSAPRRIARPPKDFATPRTASCGTYDMAASVAPRRVGGNRASRTAKDEMAPAIHIGPDDPEHLIRAVEEGGGRPVALEEAEGVVWAGGPDELPELPASVRWVQLPAAGVEPWMERVRETPDVTLHLGHRRLRDAGRRARARAADRRASAASPATRARRRGTRSTTARSKARRWRSSARAGSAGR